MVKVFVDVKGDILTQQFPPELQFYFYFFWRGMGGSIDHFVGKNCHSSIFSYHLLEHSLMTSQREVNG